MKFHNLFTFSRIKKEQKYFVAGIAVTALLTIFVVVPITFKTGVYAEQTGQTPESGAISRIKQAYDMLTALNYGSEVSSSLGDWGAMWNRLISAAEWTPDATVTADKVILGEEFYSDSRTKQTGTWDFLGNANANHVFTGETFYNSSNTLQTGTWSFLGNASTSDVLTGKTFYGNSSTLLTGTAKVPIDFSLQQFNEYDDWEGTISGSVDANPAIAVDDYEGDESVWTNTLPLTGGKEVWKDERTGLSWSHQIGTFQNKFPDQDHSSCDFFNEALYPNRGDYPGTDIDCGQTAGVDDAINQCAKLELDGDNDGIAETNWYLPTQKELMMAYIDGMYNQAGSGAGQTKLANAATFTTTNYFWSSSEVSNLPTRAWYVGLASGGTTGIPKTGTYAVRCVARD